MARNTYKERARRFFDDNELLAKKYEHFFSMENEILLALSGTPQYATDRDLLLKIVDWNRVYQKKLSDTDGRSNLPFGDEAIELVTRLMRMRKGQMIGIEAKDGEAAEQRELVTVQVIVKYRDGGEVKSRSIDQYGNGVVIHD